MPGPNPEQLKAIEHHGGALLSAGAGSGKTFVLTEHLVFLAGQWIEDWSPDRDGSFDAYIKSKFSKVVLMTFTNKAAGEIGIRINEKFQKAMENAETSSENKKTLWARALNCLDSLTISTIHGYCYKLIKQGFFSDINPNDEIIGEAQFAKQIEDLFSSWLEENSLGQDQTGEDPFFKTILKEKKAALAALKTIISDPTLRSMWKRMDPENFSLEQLKEVMKDLLFHQDFNELFDWDGNLSQWAEFEDKDWFRFLQKFKLFYDKYDYSLGRLNQWIVELTEDSFKIPVVPRAKAVPDEAKKFYKQVRDFKDFLKKNHEDFLEFEERGSVLAQDWYGKFRSLFLEVEKAYSSSNGFTFGDLEHVVNEKLEDPSVREKVKKEYEYLIIDEFQDTSYIQFGILSKIVDFDYHKVFCVGDIKQAIYGFRGGELGVFMEMQKNAPLNLNLLNNYRSDNGIIEFNNQFFSHLFKLGLNFEGKDHYAVEVAEQSAPLPERDLGKIFEIDGDLSFLEDGVMGENWKKLSVSDIEYLEALALVEHVKNTLADPDNSVAVLYRKLKPSKTLMQLLL
ncbi:MAG: UvrD-helicase domain-containing protein, partial [Bacteriovoracaceae bacterium]